MGMTLDDSVVVEGLRDDVVLLLGVGEETGLEVSEDCGDGEGRGEGDLSTVGGGGDEGGDLG